MAFATIAQKGRIFKFILRWPQGPYYKESPASLLRGGGSNFYKITVVRQQNSCRTTLGFL